MSKRTKKRSIDLNHPAIVAAFVGALLLIGGVAIGLLSPKSQPATQPANTIPVMRAMPDPNKDDSTSKQPGVPQIKAAVTTPGAEWNGTLKVTQRTMATTIDKGVRTQLLDLGTKGYATYFGIVEGKPLVKFEPNDSGAQTIDEQGSTIDVGELSVGVWSENQVILRLEPFPY